MTGTVVTFYSYKGGVGRSFTLANIAILLARWGYRVLCLDWDLEAPGLHEYLRPILASEPVSGVIDLIDDFRSGRFRVDEHVTLPAEKGRPHLVAAGRDDSGYVGRIQGVDWEELYDQGFGDYLERCRQHWVENYDYVFVDSRTGISDVGSICTAHLPDRLVVLFTANRQSMRGAVDIARRANAARDLMPFDRPQLTVLPVLSRFDTRDEYSKAEDWRKTCFDETKDLYYNWLDHAVPPELMSRHLTLPYVSYWTFGEQLPVESEENPTSDQISFALETVAAVIAHQFDRTVLLLENRDAYVAEVRSVQRDFDHDIVISSARPMMDVSEQLVRELTSRGLRVLRSISAGDRLLVNRAEDNARHLCLLVDGAVTRWQQAEAELFLYRSFGRNRRVIPVLTAKTEPNSLPGYLANLRYLSLGPKTDLASVASGVYAQVTGAPEPERSASRPETADIVTILRRAADAHLRPMLWYLVDDLLSSLALAAQRGDGSRVRELTEDLALAVRSRPGRSDRGVPAPEDTKAAITWVSDLLASRT